MKTERLFFRECEDAEAVERTYADIADKVRDSGGEIIAVSALVSEARALPMLSGATKTITIAYHLLVRVAYALPSMKEDLLISQR